MGEMRERERDASEQKGENEGLLLPAFRQGGLRVSIVSSVGTASVLY